MARTKFEELEIYDLAEDIADEVWTMVRKWDAFARDTIGKQLVRAADGIGANIAEGAGRGTYMDNRKFVRNARGSLYEVKHFPRRAFRRKLMTQKATERLKPQVDALGPKLNRFLRYLGNAAITEKARKKSTTNNYRLTTDKMGLS